MKFSEFLGMCEPYHAYLGWTSVRDAKASGLIPEKYWEFFPDTCVCGSDNVINSSLKQEMCCDPRCRVKSAYSLSEMFTRFQIKGLGPATCEKIYGLLRDEDVRLKRLGEEGIFHFSTYVETLIVPWDKYPSSVRAMIKGVEFFNACQRIQQKPLTFPQMVGALGLSSLGTNTEKIFSGINNYQELKAEIAKRGSLQNFCVSRGVSSMQMIFNLRQAMEDIIVADYIFSESLRGVGLLEIPVCITGSLSVRGKRYTKSSFVEECNRVCCDSQGVQLFEIKMSTAKMSAPFILYTTPAPAHDKYSTGFRRGIITDEFGEHEVLMRADDFYDWLKGVMSEWNKNLGKTENSQMNSCSTMLSEIMKSQMLKIRTGQTEGMRAF